jgi:flagellar hook-associated protein 3 FlgL
MRVTSNTFPNSLVDQLAQLTARQNRLHEQAATGQRLTLPEDDPSAMRRVLDLQTEGRAVAQYRHNIASLRDVAQATYEVMRGLKKVSDRAGEIATLADGTKSPDELKLYAVEVTNLIKQAVQLANTKFRGDYLLSGTASDQTPFTFATDAGGNVTSVAYGGNTSVASSEIAEGVTVSAQTIGANATGAGPRGLLADSRSGADLFNHLIALQNNLLAGNTAAISGTDLPNLKADEENILLHFGENGATQARLETSETIARKRGDGLEVLVSKEADADLAETLVRLNQTQNAYRAALQSGANILSTNLLDFLR